MPTVEEVLRFKRVEEPKLPDLITIDSHQKVGEAIDLMQRNSISQLPVVRRRPHGVPRGRHRFAAGTRFARPRVPQP